MSQFSKFTLKTLEKVISGNPVEYRRAKLLAAIEVQKLALAATLQGQTHMQQTAKGERAVRTWFIAQDGGYYVQCRYGARTLILEGKSNAVFVAKLNEVGAVLTAFAAAAKSGELDAAIADKSARKRAQ